MIIGVGIKVGDEVIHMDKPHRHPDILLKMEKLGIEWSAGQEQGFIAFLTREEAQKLAILHGQVSSPVMDRRLFSEDIW